jgi:hypothetical protein
MAQVPRKRFKSYSTEFTAFGSITNVCCFPSGPTRRTRLFCAAVPTRCNGWPEASITTLCASPETFSDALPPTLSSEIISLSGLTLRVNNSAVLFWVCAGGRFVDFLKQTLISNMFAQHANQYNGAHAYQTVLGVAVIEANIAEVKTPAHQGTLDLFRAVSSLAGFFLFVQ